MHARPAAQPGPALSACDVQPSAFGDAVRRVIYRSGIDHLADWALLEPPADRTTRRWVVSLHGHGSAGDQLYTRPDVRDHWLPRFRQLGLGILAPNLRGNAWMSPAAAADLHALLRWLRQTHGAQQVLLVSGSMGGTGSLIYAARHPDDVAGVVALCPATDLPRYHAWCAEHEAAMPVVREIRAAIERAYGGPPAQHPHRYAAHSAITHADRLRMPLAIVHGDADALIPVQQAQALAQRLRDAPHFHYEQLPGGDHDAPLARCGDALAHVLQALEPRP